MRMVPQYATPYRHSRKTALHLSSDSQRTVRFALLDTRGESEDAARETRNGQRATDPRAESDAALTHHTTLHIHGVVRDSQTLVAIASHALDAPRRSVRCILCSTTTCLTTWLPAASRARLEVLSPPQGCPMIGSVLADRRDHTVLECAVDTATSGTCCHVLRAGPRCAHQECRLPSTLTSHMRLVSGARRRSDRIQGSVASPREPPIHQTPVL